MKYNEITLKDNEGNEIIYKFRLTSGDCMTLEDKQGKSIIEIVQDESVTTLVTMIRYMRMWEEKNIGIQKAQEIYDQLIDNGWTFKRILQDVIYETLVISGFLEEADWKEIKKETEETTKRLKEERKKALEQLLNSSTTKESN